MAALDDDALALSTRENTGNMGLGFVEFIERFMEAAASRLRTTYAWSSVLATALWSSTAGS
jgi:hypothetical protein